MDMGSTSLKKNAVAIALAALASSSLTHPAHALETAKSVSDAGVVSQNLNGYKAPVKPKGIPAQPAPGRPSERRYWMTPDKIKIFKIRGNSMEGSDLRTNDSNKDSRRDILPLLPWNRGSWTGAIDPKFKLPPAVEKALGRVPKSEVYGWGEEVPYDQSYFDQGAAFEIPLEGASMLGGSVRTRPFDAGLTRYEMWVGKDGQRSTRGSAPFAWYFHSYNVVTQGGQVLGMIDIDTADTLYPEGRSFRDAPYLVDVVEDSSIMRTYSESPTFLSAPGTPSNASVMTNSLSLVSQPKMLVLTSPNYEGTFDDSVKEGSASYNRKLDEATENTRQAPPRKYSVTQSPNGVMGSDIGSLLAPNKGIHDAGPEISKDGALPTYGETPLAQNWHFDSGTKKWHFKRWQRSELLDPSKASHRWVLETKEDLLFAPQQLDDQTQDPTKFKIVDEESGNVSSVANMVVAKAQVLSFDTGGFRMAKTTDALTSFDGVENISDKAAINILPVGGFYPDSSVIVALEYLLLNADGTASAGGWQTGKIHYWSSKSDESKGAYDQRSIKFQPSSGQFDPYEDAWIFPIKDVSHTSAQYRLRVFMSLPIASSPTSLVSMEEVPGQSPKGPLPLTLSTGGANRPGGNYEPSSFEIGDMQSLLKRNSDHPTDPSSMSPEDSKAAISRSIRESDALGTNYSAYLEALGVGGELLSPGKYTGVGQVVRVDPGTVRSVVTSAVFASGGRKLISDEALAQVLYPYGDGGTSWFEYRLENSPAWTVKVPSVNIGVDEDASGVIITE
jgi:hypothetical protein